MIIDNEWMTELTIGNDGLPKSKQTITKEGNRFTIIVDKSNYPFLCISWQVFDGKTLIASGLTDKKMTAWSIAEKFADELEALCIQFDATPERAA